MYWYSVGVTGIIPHNITFRSLAMTEVKILTAAVYRRYTAESRNWDC
jgi:hypothetical protein